MWKLAPTALLHLKGAGGERFAHFVDRLIRAEAARGGTPQAAVRTQLRVNIKDGGVDTEVQESVPRDGSGWLGERTCWQFKALEADQIDDKVKKTKANDLQEDLRKGYAQNLVKQGYAWRFCLLGDLPPEKARNWEAQLKAEAQRINPQAPPPRVVHGGDLLSWAERFPAVVVWLRGLAQGVFHWEAWGETCRAVTQTYVPNPAWNGVSRQILQHTNFRTACAGGGPCLPIGGAAGVGKTRLVFETLSSLPEAPGLVIYARDEQEARRVATAIANTADQTAILVADECPPPARHFLNESLRGHANRVRVVCLDNTGERLVSPATQVWLSADALTNTGAILEANFSHVPPDRRLQYAQLARGFVRLAADMCEHDAELAGGDLSGLLGSVERYVRHRLLGEYLPIVSLLALFQKVGFREEVAGDLEALCQLTGYARQQFLDVARSVKESPGFLVQAGRYWYVTPEIVARILFAEGWQQWGSADPDNFLKRLPEHLLKQLLDRAGTHGGKEVRDQLAAFFRRSFNRLTAADLSDANAASFAAALVEAAPEQNLSLLRSVIAAADPGELNQITGEARGGMWGPRRTLVWLLERLVSFPEFFRDGEACLFRLALHETESQIGNNATAIWRNLFAVHLSGTATSFRDRLGVLRERAASPRSEEGALAFQGIAAVLGRPFGKLLGRPIVAGQLRPADWEPASADEERACYRAALALCAEHLVADPARRRWAFDVLVAHLVFLLRWGLLEELRGIVSRDRLTEEETRQVIGAVDQFLDVPQGMGPAEGNERTVHYFQNVRAWVETLRPSDFRGQLRSVGARDPWDRRFTNKDSHATDETDALAAQLVVQPALLLGELDWLASPEARSAEQLGFALGRSDAVFRCGRMIFEDASARGAAPLVRGYVRGMVYAHREPNKELLDRIDELEARRPELAVDLLTFGGDSFGGLERALALVESKAVSPRALAPFARGLGRRQLTAEEVARVLLYFVQAAAGDDAETARVGLRFLYTYLMGESSSPSRKCLDTETTRAQAWGLIETSLPHLGGQVAREWGEILGQLAVYDAGRAASLLGQALLSESGHLRDQAEELLVKFSQNYPEPVMQAFGSALLDPDRGWCLQVSVYRELLARLPPSVVIGWVREHGRTGARVIARHLPIPHLDEAGRPVVPEIVDVILREFGDEEVLASFVAGALSGEGWWGGVAERFRREAAEARVFLNHVNPGVREWARRWIAERERLAEWEARESEEQFLAP